MALMETEKPVMSALILMIPASLSYSREADIMSCHLRLISPMHPFSFGEHVTMIPAKTGGVMYLMLRWDCQAALFVLEEQLQSVPIYLALI